MGKKKRKLPKIAVPEPVVFDAELIKCEGSLALRLDLETMEEEKKNESSILSSTRLTKITSSMKVATEAKKILDYLSYLVDKTATKISQEQSEIARNWEAIWICAIRFSPFLNCGIISLKCANHRKSPGKELEKSLKVKRKQKKN